MQNLMILAGMTFTIYLAILMVIQLFLVLGCWVSSSAMNQEDGNPYP